MKLFAPVPETVDLGRERVESRVRRRVWAVVRKFVTTVARHYATTKPKLCGIDVPSVQASNSVYRVSPLVTLLEVLAYRAPYFRVNLTGCLIVTVEREPR
jgi:hypothetical protein